MLVWFAAGKSLFGESWCDGIDVAGTYRQYAIFVEQAPLMAGGLPSFLTSKGQKARDAISRDVVLPAVQAMLDKERVESQSDLQRAHPYLARYVAACYAAHGDDAEKVARRLMGLLFAIMTNTMNLMYWTIVRLHTISEDEQRTIRHEVISQMSANSTYEELKRRMPCFNSLLLETIRMHSDPNSFRVVEQDCSVDGLSGGEDLAFRKGDQVFLLSSFDQMSRTDDVQDPGVFCSQRWHHYTSSDDMSQKLLQMPATQVLAPFGGG